MDLKHYEDRTQRRTWQEQDGTAYRRTYNVPADAASTLLPAEGDALPGETDSGLGPFVEKNGITFGQQKAGGMQEIILKGKLLKART